MTATILAWLASHWRQVLAAVVLTAIAGVLLATGWHFGGLEARRQLAELQLQMASTTAARATAAAKESEQTAQKEQTHAADTIHAADAYVAGAPEREARLRSELADAQRLRDAAVQRAAGYRAQADAGAEACRRLADRAGQLDDALARGRGLAAELRGALERRDAEVALLLDLLAADDALLAP